MLSKPILFAATTIAERSRHFYADLLGLTLKEDTPYALVFDVNGITLREQKVKKVVAVPYTSIGFEVQDLQQTVTELSSSGIRFEQYPFLEQDAAGIWTTPDGARVAWCRDPDGTTVPFSQHPETGGN